MAINEQIYGSSENWRDVYYFLSSQTPKNKKAYFAANQSQLAQGVTAGKLSYSTPIDKSLSYCGLGSECALSNIVYYQRSGTDVTEKETENRFQTNFFFSEKTDTSHTYFGANAPTLGGNDNNRLNDWQSSYDRFNQNPWLEPYTKILPKNICLLIRVKCRATTTGTTQDYDLSTYLTSHRTTEKYIECVYVEQYNGSETYRRLNGEKITGSYNIPFNIATLDGYNVNSETHYAYNLSENIVFGALSKSAMRWDAGYMPVYYTENSKPHTTVTANNSGGIYYCNVNVEYYPEFEEDILKTVACFGLYFTPKTSVATGGTLTNADMYIGLLDENGIGHGEYLRGTDTSTAPQNNYTDMTQTGYDYTKEVDKTKYKNDTQFNTSLSLGAFTKFYQLTESQVNDLCTALYTAVNDQPQGTPIEEYNMKCFLTNNPIDCIISLKKFPLNHFPSVAGVIDDVYLGTVDSGINAPRVLSTTWVYYFDFSNSNDTGLYPVNGGDFRDFEPYTTVQINVPFCGSFEVPTTYFYKYGGVRVALMIDFVSGACTAYLIVNGDVVDSVSGSCAVDLPVTGLQSATLDGNIHSAAMAEKSAQTSGTLSMVAGAISIGAGIVTGNPLLAIGGVTALVGGATSLEKNQAQIDYDLQHMQLPLKQVGAASGAIAQCGDYRCKMIIKRPVMLNYNDEVYSKTIGYACLLNGNVSNFHGLTYGEIDLTNINCSESEKEMIKSAFASGVYLP